MIEVFKSEAIHTLSSLIWTVFVLGIMLIVSILSGVVAYNSSTLSYIPSITTAGITAYVFFRAKSYYHIINTYIHFPPNCKIVNGQLLTYDD